MTDGVLKKENMKTKFVIVLVLQTVLILIFLALALIQKKRADKQTEFAEMATRQAQQEVIKAEKLRLQLDSVKEIINRP